MLTYGAVSAYAEYNSFWVDPESDNYRLHVTGYSGTAGMCIKNKPYIYI
jgi:hypothetical protein